jgi:hypothetical protein
VTTSSGRLPFLEQRELERLGAADEQPAAQAVLALRHPAPAVVPADEKER